jgi:hypothetical protein
MHDTVAFQFHFPREQGNHQVGQGGFTLGRLQDSGYDNETRNQEVKRDFVLLDGKGETFGEKAHTKMTFQKLH